MPLVATSVVGARASQFSSSASSSARLLPALAHRTRAYRPLMTPAGSGRARLQVRAARLESTGVSVGFRGPQFELPEPMTGKIWTLDDFEGSPALLSQEAAKAFQAVCTPEFYLFKKDGRRPFELFYHGQFDDSRPGSNVPVTGKDLSHAIDCALSGQEFPFVQRPSVGCSIKWNQ
ncbi:hypothetical protein ACQ4PT_059632 [Festuca glaucescens]